MEEILHHLTCNGIFTYILYIYIIYIIYIYVYIYTYLPYQLVQDLFHQQYVSLCLTVREIHHFPTPKVDGDVDGDPYVFVWFLGFTLHHQKKHGNLKITQWKRTVIFQTTNFWVSRQFSQGIVCMVWLIIHPHVSRVQILFLVCSQQKFQHTSAPSTIYSQMSAHIIPGIQNTLVILLVPI